MQLAVMFIVYYIDNLCMMFVWCTNGDVRVLVVFERIRGILTEATIDKRVQYMIDVLFAVRKDKYKVQDYLSSFYVSCGVVSECCRVTGLSGCNLGAGLGRRVRTSHTSVDTGR